MAEEDHAYRLSSARVMIADDDRLYRDFEQLRPAALLAANPQLTSFSDGHLTQLLPRVAGQWLLENAALITAKQMQASEVNAVPPVQGTARKVFRPPLYGRACITEVPDVQIAFPEFSTEVYVPGGGELDIKGVGVREDSVPIRGDHTDGLLRLKYAVQEYMIERLICSLLDHAHSAHRTLPHYAVLDTGFDGFAESGEPFAAGLIVRKAHRRNPKSDLPAWRTPEQHELFGIELALRKYGITSAKRNSLVIRREGDRLVASQWGRLADLPHETVAHAVNELGLEIPFEAEGVNVQVDSDKVSTSKQVVDFAHYSARNRFDRALVSLVCDRKLAWGGIIVPSDSCFVQPDPAIMPEGPLWEDAIQHNGNLFGTIAEEFVNGFRSGKLSHDEISTRIPDLVAGMIPRLLT